MRTEVTCVTSVWHFRSEATHFSRPSPCPHALPWDVLMVDPSDKTGKIRPLKSCGAGRQRSPMRSPGDSRASSKPAGHQLTPPHLPPSATAHGQLARKLSSKASATSWEGRGGTHRGRIGAHSGGRVGRTRSFPGRWRFRDNESWWQKQDRVQGALPIKHKGGGHELRGLIMGVIGVWHIVKVTEGKPKSEIHVYSVIVVYDLKLQ